MCSPNFIGLFFYTGRVALKNAALCAANGFNKKEMMMNSMLFAVAAYLIGSVSFAVVVSKLFGLSDPRTYGSGNPGATNVLRSGNKAAAVLTLLGDCFKGWLAVWLARTLASQFGIGDNGIALVALAVLLGHLLPGF